VVLPELGCAVYGSAFTAADRPDDPLAGFCAPDDGLIHLMVVHGDVGGNRYGPIDPRSLAGSGLDYAALGHIHACSGLQRTGDTFWAYPGCPEGRGFDEPGEKGALVVCLDEAGSCTARFAPLCSRRYEIVEVDLTGCEDALAAVEAALPVHSTDRDIYRLRLTGSFAMTSGLLRQLEQALAPRFWALDLQDRTRMPRDLWARAQEDSLTGLFLQIMADRCQQQPDDEALQLAARFGLAALENGEDVAP
jgi:DNA repair exonuclease SbcCD nuclease subunit